MALTPQQAAEAQAAIDRGESFQAVAGRYGYHGTDVGLATFERDLRARMGEPPIPEGTRYTPSEEVMERYKPSPEPIGPSITPSPGEVPFIEPPIKPIAEVTMPTRPYVPPAVIERAGLVYSYQQTPEAIAEAGKQWMAARTRGVEAHFVQAYEPAKVKETEEAYLRAEEKFEAAGYRAFGPDWQKIIDRLSEEMPKEIAVEPGTMLTPEAYKAWEKAFYKHYGVMPETLKERWPSVEGPLKALSGVAEVHGLEVSRFESFLGIREKIATWEYERSLKSEWDKLMSVSVPSPSYELRKAIFGEEAPAVKMHEELFGEIYPFKVAAGVGEMALWYGAFAAVGYVGGLAARAVGSTVAKGVKAVTITPLTKLAPRVSPAVASRWASLAPRASAWALRHPVAVKAAAYGVPYGAYGGLEAWKVKTMYEAGVTSRDIMWQVSKDIAMVAGFGRGFTWGLKTDLPARLRAIGKQRVSPEEIFSPRTLAGEQQIPLGKYKTVDQLVAEFKVGKYGLEALPDEEFLMTSSALRREMDLLVRKFGLAAKHPPPVQYYPEATRLLGRYRSPIWMKGERAFTFKQWPLRKLFVEKIQVWKVSLSPPESHYYALETLHHEFKHWKDVITRGWSTEKSAEAFQKLLTPQDFLRFSKSLERYWVWHATHHPFKKVTTVLPGFRAEKGLFVAPEPSVHFLRIPTEGVAPYTKVLGWGVPPRPTALYIGVTDILKSYAAQRASAAYITRKATLGIQLGARIEKEAVIPTGTVLEKIAGKEYSIWQGRVFNIDRYLAWSGDAAKLATQKGAKSIGQVLSYYEREMGRALITPAGYSYAIAGLVSSLRPPPPTYYQPKPYYQPARAYPTPPIYKAPSIPSYKPVPPYEPYQPPYPPDVYKPPPPPYIYKPPAPSYIPPPPVYRPYPPLGEFPKPLALPKVKKAKFKPFERRWPVGEIERLFEAKARRIRDVFKVPEYREPKMPKIRLPEFEDPFELPKMRRKRKR